MRARGLARLIAAVLLSLPLAGCWSRIETNELGVVIGFGVDWQAGTYRVTASVLDPGALGSPGQGGAQASPTQPAHVLMTGTGSTPGQALAEVNSVSSRHILWGSAQVVVIGQSLAQRGIGPLLSALTHDPLFRPTTRVLIAHGEARGIFAVNNAGLETSIGRDLFLMVQNTHRTESYAWAPHIFDVGRWQSEEDRAMLIPGVSGTTPGLPQGVAYTMDDSAVLLDGRLVAWMTRSEVRPVLWMEGLFVHGHIAVPCPGGAGAEGLVSLSSGGERVRGVVQSGRVVAVDVRLTGDGAVSQGCTGASPTAMSSVASAAVAAAARQSLAWAQGHQLDVLGFGEVVFRHFPHLFLHRYAQDWAATFSQLPVHLSVDINVAQPGITR